MDKRRTSLIALREKAGLSQYDVAAKLGIPRSTYGQIELGVRPLRIEMAAKLAQVFGCTIDAIFYGDGGPEMNPKPESDNAVAANGGVPPWPSPSVTVASPECTGGPNGA